MTYSCSDFTDTILDALGIDVPDVSADSPSHQADLCLAEIARLHCLAEIARRHHIAAHAKPTPALAITNPVINARAALNHLTAARDLLADIGATRTLNRVRLAISSAKGAVRNATLKTDRRAAA